MFQRSFSRTMTVFLFWMAVNHFSVTQQAENRTFESHISRIIKYLNKKPESRCYYSNGTIKDVQPMPDNQINLAFQVQTQCLNVSSGTYQNALVCHVETWADLHDIKDLQPFNYLECAAKDFACNFQIGFENERQRLYSDGDECWSRSRSSDIDGIKLTSADRDVNYFVKQSIDDLNRETRQEYKLQDIFQAFFRKKKGFRYHIQAIVQILDCKNPCPSKSMNMTYCQLEVSVPKGSTTKPNVQTKCHDPNEPLDFMVPSPENDPQVKRLLKESMDKINSESDSKFRYVVISIEHCTFRMKTRKIYDIEVKIGLSNCTKEQNEEENCKVFSENQQDDCIFEESDQEKNVTIYCFVLHRRSFGGDSLPIDSKEGSASIRRSVGGDSLPIDSEEAKDNVRIALKEMDSKAVLPQRLMATEVLQAIRKVGEHQSFFIKARVVLSDCLKSEAATNQTKCLPTRGALALLCELRVIHSKKISVTSRCMPPLPQLVRGGMNVGRKILKESMELLNALSEFDEAYVIADQSGIILKLHNSSQFVMEASVCLSNCPKHNWFYAKQCQVVIGRRCLYCTFSAFRWHRYAEARVSTPDCRTKGKLTYFEVGDPKIIALAERATQDVNAKSKEKFKYVIDSIEQAHVETLDGYLYTIRCTLVLSDCEQYQSGHCTALLGGDKQKCLYTLRDYIDTTVRKITTLCQNVAQKAPGFRKTLFFAD